LKLRDVPGSDTNRTLAGPFLEQRRLTSDDIWKEGVGDLSDEGMRSRSAGIGNRKRGRIQRTNMAKDVARGGNMFSKGGDSPSGAEKGLGGEKVGE